MSSYIPALESSFYTVGEELETAFRSFKNLPQNKYLTRPIYKTCVQRVGPAAATALSFLSADLLVHQLLPQVGICLLSKVINPVIPEDWLETLGLSDPCNFSYNYYVTLSWTILAVPIMYAKYKRSQR